jgi:parallel beta-helix repeat protein
VGIIILIAVALIFFLPRRLTVPDDYATIQDAVDNASPGDTVFVKEGIYNESFTIDKPLSLVGEESGKTIIISPPYSRYGPQSAVRVSAESVTISGFTIKGAQVGIWVETIGSIHQPSGCRIVGNNIINNTIGVHSFGGDNLSISENNITGNSEYGIYYSSSNSIIYGNNITGNSGLGIIIDSCTNVTISINDISNNNEGLELRWSGPFNVNGNNITGNQKYGVQLGEGCCNATVHENNIERNNIGVNLLNFLIEGDATIGSGNTVYLNNLIDNSQNAFVEHTFPYNITNIVGASGNGTDIVSWDNGKQGNYWSDYRSRYPNATEVGILGTGDTPYVINENNIDQYPLMQTVGILIVADNITVGGRYEWIIVDTGQDSYFAYSLKTHSEYL